MSDAIKVGLDFGANRLKYAYRVDNKDLKYGIMYNTYLTGDNVTADGFKVIRNDRVNRIGSINGTSNMEQVKTNYDYLDDIVLAVAKDIKNNIECDNHMTLTINTLLPPSQFLSVANEFKKKLIDYGKIEGQVNGDKLEVTIDGVKVCCEGIALLMTIDIDNICKLDRCILIDMGSSTTNFVKLQKINGIWSVITAETDDTIGGSILIKAITNGLRTQYPNIPFKPDVLERDMCFYINGEKHELTKYVEHAKDTILGLEKKFKKYYTGGNIIVTGGAGQLLMHSETFKNICPVEPIALSDEVCTYGNCRGAYLS